MIKLLLFSLLTTTLSLASEHKRVDFSNNTGLTVTILLGNVYASSLSASMPMRCKRAITLSANEQVTFIKPSLLQREITISTEL